MVEQNPVLSDHTRKGKLLIPPLVKIGVQLLDWEGQYIPEHLWLSYLIRGRSVSEAAAIFNASCDIIDAFFQPQDAGHVFLGYISDFHFVQGTRRKELLDALEADGIAATSVQEDFRRAIGLYPHRPADWLALEPDDERTTSVAVLRALVAALREQKTGAAAQCRILPFNRLLKHDVFRIVRGAVDEDVLHGLSNYPNVNEEMAQRVEQFLRTALNIALQWRPRTGWAPGFWASNLSMVVCQ